MYGIEKELKVGQTIELNGTDVVNGTPDDFVPFWTNGLQATVLEPLGSSWLGDFYVCRLDVDVHSLAARIHAWDSVMSSTGGKMATPAQVESWFQCPNLEHEGLILNVSVDQIERLINRSASITRGDS